MNACHKVGVTSLADKYERAREDILKHIHDTEPELDLTEMDGLTRLQEMNNSMMNYLFSGDFYGAREALKKAGKNTDYSNSAEVAALIQNASRYAIFSSKFGAVKYENYVKTILERCIEAFPDNVDIKSRYYEGKAALLQGKAYEDFQNRGRHRLEYRQEVLDLISEVDAQGDSISSDAWGMVAFGFLYVADETDEQKILNLISNAEQRLSSERSEETAKTWMALQQKLYNLRRISVPKSVIEQAFAYYLRSPSSETTRGIFFALLDASTEKTNKDKYILPIVKDSMMHDAMFNPLYSEDAKMQLLEALIDSDHPESIARGTSDPEGKAPVVDLFGLMEDEPVVRKHKKIGRNDPCPCGSGKKFKKCCMGNGKYD